MHSPAATQWPHSRPSCPCCPFGVGSRGPRSCPKSFWVVQPDACCMGRVGSPSQAFLGTCPCIRGCPLPTVPFLQVSRTLTSWSFTELLRSMGPLTWCICAVTWTVLSLPRTAVRSSPVAVTSKCPWCPATTVHGSVRISKLAVPILPLSSSLLLSPYLDHGWPLVLPEWEMARYE